MPGCRVYISKDVLFNESRFPFQEHTTKTTFLASSSSNYPLTILSQPFSPTTFPSLALSSTRHNSLHSPLTFSSPTSYTSPPHHPTSPILQHTASPLPYRAPTPATPFLIFLFLPIFLIQSLCSFTAFLCFFYP